MTKRERESQGRSCPEKGKSRYGNRKLALSAAAHQSKYSGIELRVYKCGYCKDWHLTKSEQF
ncbi:MAG: hypothetical protein WCP20_11140 [Desulfuromonadales bacterium]